MNSQPTLLLRRSEVAELLTMDACIASVEQAFWLHGKGKAATPGVLAVHLENGGFHIKAGVLGLSRSYFAAKVNANFPQNRERHGLPTIQGVIVLCDGANGKPLAVMDSMEITAQRTAAATAVAAKYLARLESGVITICGCGSQGRVQLRALRRVLPVRKVYACDRDSDHARCFAREMSTELQVDIEAVSQAGDAASRSYVCVTCTTSLKPVLAAEHIRPGTFIAAVGADSPEKQELHPALMAAGKVVTDLTEQCAAFGDLHHAIAAGVMKREDVHAELGEVVAGRKSGRTSPEEITIFDSTGMALQDVAAAALVYGKAVTAKCGLTLDLAA